MWSLNSLMFRTTKFNKTFIKDCISSVFFFFFFKYINNLFCKRICSHAFPPWNCLWPASECFKKVFVNCVCMVVQGYFKEHAKAGIKIGGRNLSKLHHFYEGTSSWTWALNWKSWFVLCASYLYVNCLQNVSFFISFYGMLYSFELELSLYHLSS